MSGIVNRAEHLIDGITEGPWAWDEWPDRSEISSPAGELLAVLPSVLVREQSSRDARFIAAARQLVPELLAEIVRLRTELAQPSRT
jgi:hypothetical protein